MNIKSFSLLSLLFVGQTILSCNPCSCTVGGTIEVNYDELEVRVFDISGTEPVLVSDMVSQGDFRLNVGLFVEENKVAMITGFGFNQANACDCIGPEYLFDDPIMSMQVFEVDANDVETEISESIAVESNSSESSSLMDYFPTGNEEEWHYGYSLIFSESYRAPEQVVFRVEIQLQSGIVISNVSSQLQVAE